jgi:hypothetical protein
MPKFYSENKVTMCREKADPGRLTCSIDFFAAGPRKSADAQETVY